MGISNACVAMHGGPCPTVSSDITPWNLLHLSEAKERPANSIQKDGRNFKMDPSDRTKLKTYFDSIGFNEKTGLHFEAFLTGTVQQFDTVAPEQYRCSYNIKINIAHNPRKDLEFSLINYVNNQ